MSRLLFLTLLFTIVNVPAPAQVQPLGLKHVTFVVKLMSPISTNTSNPGDTFAALVESPSEYHGAVFVGKITKLKKPKKGVGKGKAEIAFQFDALTANGNTHPVIADLKDVTNSKGVKSVDEEGQIIGKTSNKKRVGAAAGGAGLGVLIGALGGGAQGAAVGGAAGLAAGIAIGLTMTTTGSQLEFLPGSHFTLDVSDRNRK
ncbi:MAG TPA: hypothetical protein VKU19_06245 [Bryobacteraceae bacterium]|nr:hypothetical protein [Bryobacteraceae bacterium]